MDFFTRRATDNHADFVTSYLHPDEELRLYAQEFEHSFSEISIFQGALSKSMSPRAEFRCLAAYQPARSTTSLS
jgi:hypothetical protein